MKRCTLCGRKKALTEFYKARNGAPRARCKLCTNAKHAAYCAQNPEPARRAVAAYRKRNPDRPRGRVRGKLQHAYVRVLRRDPCAYCGRPMKHVDHIVPLARGGENTWDNYTAACEPCNERKQATPMLLFMLRLVVA